MEYMPLFVKLTGRPCLVVGGGDVAERKALQLLKAGARITINALAINSGLTALASAGKVHFEQGEFEPALASTHFLVVAATDDTAVNTRVYQAANQAGRLVNVVDDPKRCNYITPAVVDRAPVVVAISSGGAAPVLARQIRDRIERLLPRKLGQLAEFARGWRDRVQTRLGSFAQRLRFWEMFFEGTIAEHIYAGRTQQADIATDTLLRDADHAQPTGEVYLVGAGPGDPSLLTLRAVQLMQKADVILYDRLVSESVLDLARRDATRIFVGKKPGCDPLTQDRINALLVEHASAGRRVCRLKGGDPFVFGRGGEELQVLVKAGIGFQVVPGITAAAACAAYAGIPLTHRDFAQSARFVTAHCQASVDCLDWPSLAKDRQTLAFYMGVRRLGDIRDQLIAHGRDPATPFALVENGTLPGQRVVTGDLRELAEIAQRESVQAPAILIVGEVASLSGQLAWFGDANPSLPATHSVALSA